MVKAVAFVSGLGISVVGAAGVVAPSLLVWVARLFVSSTAFYLLAVVRIAFGLILISVAPASRLPRAIRVLGYVILVLGIGAALAGLVAIGPARDAIDSWLHQGSGVVRLTGIPVLALGTFVAYACAPDGRAA